MVDEYLMFCALDGRLQYRDEMRSDLFEDALLILEPRYKRAYEEAKDLDDVQGDCSCMKADTAWTTGLIFGMRLAGASRFLPLSGYTRA